MLWLAFEMDDIRPYTRDAIVRQRASAITALDHMKIDDILASIDETFELIHNGDERDIVLMFALIRIIQYHVFITLTWYE